MSVLLLPDAPDSLIELFAPLSALPFAMLLDSAAKNHINSRYDILVAQPLVTLEAKGRLCTVTTPDGCHQQDADPFELVKTLQQQYLGDCQNTQHTLPFTGGALGYIGYDAGRVIEQLPAQAKDDIALPDLVMGLYPWALVLDKQLQQLWYVDCRGDAAERWPVQQAWLQAQQQMYLQQQHPNFLLSSAWQANMDKTQYQQKFEQIQAYLKSGDCYQINLAQRFSARYQGDEWQAYLKLRASNAAPFSAFIRLTQGAVLSISPERFIALNNGQVETKPIKGTKPRFADTTLDAQSASALQQSAKDRAENVMIVDLLRNDLGKVCKPGSVKVPSLFAIESFPAVHHLVSTVTGELNTNLGGVDLLKAAFPGGSITGAPKIRAMEIIEELEPCRRSVYCGSIVYFSQHGRMDSNIAIRTLLCVDGQIHCWAGGGIVADSTFASEYQETFDKVARILPVLTAL
ncbi:aminodeoxychorismate synthase component I [Rheinheimera sp. 4Y26]|uniref:aminodeoxychorismate synthase component I n=1 Tax=Rheinheimera sp. 4Y26 TaxID=2977811 RepID=UPI0021B126CE|nr:aminodeoxychorismate synthase component I [Rheinheimera sp. 4Y26]MCT6700810.1 aminodeoxychorismate synthase component I [Rheinheimera sp. 4Y26]